MTSQASKAPGGTEGPAASGPPGPLRGSWRGFAVGTVILTALFSPWLFAWARFALNDDLSSYVLIIPVVSLSLMWKARGTTPGPAGSARGPGVTALGLAAALVALAFLSPDATPETAHNFLAPAMLGYVAGLVAWAWLTLGRAVVRHHAFALGFLAFMAPLPSWAVHGLEIFFQHTSAEVAAWMMQVAGIPTLRSGLYFQLPGITIQVAQECSGIRSSLVLFIVSVYGGHLILRTTARRWVLALFVIPLGIARNGFRILTIAWLCSSFGSDMIDSPIHHRGGPIFFAVSLIPLFLLLFWLRRGERNAAASPPDGAVRESPRPARRAGELGTSG